MQWSARHYSGNIFNRFIGLSLFLILCQSGIAQNYNILLKIADEKYNKKEFIESAHIYEEAHALYPEISMILFKTAESYYMAHSYEKSLTYLTELHRKAPGKYPIAYYYEADILKMLGKYNDAIPAFKYYYRNFDTGGENNIKAVLQVLGCEFAKSNTHRTEDFEDIQKLGYPYNSENSELNIGEYEDSTIIYASVVPFKDSSIYLGHLFSNNKRYRFLSLINTINKSDKNIIDLSISPDRKLAFYTACTDTMGSNDFKIYYCRFDSLRWFEPQLADDHINIEGFRSTQPYFTKIGGKDYLFFVSDRPGGYGNLDIWYSQWVYNRFTKPVNVGSTINTIGDEVTPFYDTTNQSLYFSSDILKGFGGFDIFHSKGVPGNWSEPENAGKPINSSFHDVYFTQNPKNTRCYFTSDRDSIRIGKDIFHFNDFYSAKIVKPIIKDSLSKQDSAMVASNSGKQKNKLSLTAELTQENKPITYSLFFDLNEPGKMGSVAEYDSYYNKYIENLSSLSNISMKITVNGAFESFNRFLDKTLMLLASSQKLTLKLTAFTSPTGNQKYNQKLAIRRQESVKKYIENYDSGKLKPYLHSKIVIELLSPEISESQTYNNETPEMSPLRRVDISILIEK